MVDGAVPKLAGSAAKDAETSAAATRSCGSDFMVNSGLQRVRKVRTAFSAEGVNLEALKFY
jgi:hypothetical protein